MCRNVQVARPSSSLSAGHSRGVTGVVVGTEEGPEANEPIRAAIPVLPEAAAAALALALEVASFGFVAIGFQLRNAVHGLQGFPSGPRTIPELASSFFCESFSVEFTAMVRCGGAMNARYVVGSSG